MVKKEARSEVSGINLNVINKRSKSHKKVVISKTEIKHKMTVKKMDFSLNIRKIMGFNEREK